jgi:hypothetical protein
MPQRGKQVVVHVGAHKTGTSAIQKYLRDNRRTAQRHRIACISRSATNESIGWGGILRKDPTVLRRQILQASKNPWYRTIIASHENTLGRPFGNDPSAAECLYPDVFKFAEPLAAILHEFDGKVVFYLREQSAFLESYYLQHVHEGGSTPFSEWLAKIDLDRMSWRPAVEHLRVIFGPHRVALGRFEEIKDGQDEFLRQFLLRVDDRITLEPTYDAHRNSSISARGLEIALRINPLLETHKERKIVRKFLQRHFSNRNQPRAVLLTPEQKGYIASRYSSENEALVQGGSAPAYV